MPFVTSGERARHAAERSAPLRPSRPGTCQPGTLIEVQGVIQKADALEAIKRRLTGLPHVP